MTGHFLEANLDAWTRRYGPPPAWAADRTPDHDAPVPLTKAEVDRWVAAEVPAGTRTLLMIGAGAGELLDALAAHPTTLRAVVVEPQPAVARALLTRRDWSGWLSEGRLGILSGPAYAGAAQVAAVHTDLHEARVVVHPWLAAERPDEVASARRAIAQITFQATANENARKASAGRYVLHTLANAVRIAREGNVAALAALTPGTPAIIVAAGPSLDRNIHDLALVKDRALLIACDTAAWPLLGCGLDPDFVVGADPTRTNAGHLSSLPATRAWLVAEGSLHPSAFAHFADRTFGFRVAAHEPWPWLQSLGVDRGVIGTWGSVATSAFSLAIALGCDPIIFAGADFAFTGGRPYCRGTSFEPLWATWHAGGVTEAEIWTSLIGRWPEMQAADIHGAPARTARHLVSFRDWVVERAAAHPASRVINATGAGLLHGAAIAQGTAGATLGASPIIDRTAVQRAILDAHRRSRGSAAAILGGVTRIAAGLEGATVERWLQFAAPTLTRAAIDAALRSPEYDAWALALSLTCPTEGPS